MHIYAFGSVCRGEVTPGSDVDLLAITQGQDPRFDSNAYSVYSYARLQDIWRDGNPFAWHLWLESKMLYSEDGTNFVVGLGAPAAYGSVIQDCKKFASLFDGARNSIIRGSNSRIFELSTVFLSIRNFATCFALGTGATPDFSRSSALRLGHDSLSLPPEVYSILERARILCTRGVGACIDDAEIHLASRNLDKVEGWMNQLLWTVGAHE